MPKDQAAGRSARALLGTWAMSSSWQRIGTGILFLLVVCTIGTGGYLAAGWGLLDSVYMVVITIFGVGYGEVNALDSTPLRLFTIFLIVAGCSALIYILGGLFQLITEGELNRLMGRRRMTKEISRLRDHIIVCGFGRLGRVLATEFAESGQAFVIVDLDAARVTEAVEAGYVVIEGDASDEAILEAAGIEGARALTTVLPQDAVNVFITLTARTLNADIQIIARGENPSTERKLKHAGATQVVLPAAIGAVRIANLITRPSVVDDFDHFKLSNLRIELANIGVEIDQMQIPAGSNLVARTVGELEGSGDGGLLVVAVHRSDGSTIKNPTRDFVLDEGDILMLIGHEEDIPDLTARYRLINLQAAEQVAAD